MKKSILIAILSFFSLLIPMSATAASASIYAANSALSSGKWVKIRVPATGICRLSTDVISKAGFSNLSNVRIYGYGGGMIPEKLTENWLAEHEDLKEVATCIVGDSKYFFATGTVSWETNTSTKRTRNPYSNYGYYFITDNGTPGLSCSEADLRAAYTNSTFSHHYLYENEQYSWSHLGRNLVDGTEIPAGSSKQFQVLIPSSNTSASIQVSVAAGAASSCKVVCGTATSTMSFRFGEYDRQKFSTLNFNVSNVANYASGDGMAYYPVSITNTGSSPLRLDYISASFSNPYGAPALDASCPSAEYVQEVANQNHHADELADLTIIIPTSGELYKAANRLAEHHRNYDGISVRIIPAAELYNEFASGTPDFSAFKRYMKMFYDRGQVEGRTPRPAVLLFGDAIWDNRRLAVSENSYPSDNYLLCYQTEASESWLSSITSDDFITVMQDNRNIHVDSNDGSDRDLQFGIGVGRIPVSTPAEANVVVDKLIHYATSSPAGNWQNEIMFIGDDGDRNSHMENMNINANAVMHNSPGFHVKKVMLDAYEMKTVSTGDSYPEVTKLLTKQQNDGALVMNYGGHASWTLLSHEKILLLNDFLKFKGENYSFWFTAGCETVPFDQTYNTLGETALLNSAGGAMGFYGTVRTVMETKNSYIDLAFMRYALAYDANGRPNTLGEAQRLAKNDLVTSVNINYKDDKTGAIKTVSAKDVTVNKHQYVLIGDPMMRLALPQNVAKIDAINGKSTSEGTETIKGNSIVTINGHIEDRNGNVKEDFNGTANVLIRDAEKSIKCRDNSGDFTSESDYFVYKDRITNLYKGSCKVSGGRFSLTFRVPRDILDSGENGLVTIYAMDENTKAAANGECGSFSAQGWEDVNDDQQGPSIFCYLNNDSFRNGDGVGRTPFFVAEISDKDGINATGSSLGHNMELIVDDKASQTYDITDNFVFDEGSYTSGRTYFVLEPLEEGNHKLDFKAWDMLNNSTTVSLNFWVKRGMAPDITKVRVYPNPVKGTATFYVTHDMQGSEAHIRVEIISPSGKMAQVLEWDDVFSDKSNTTTYKWSPDGLERGLYLYRVRVSCDNSDYTSKTEKLIIAQ